MANYRKMYSTLFHAVTEVIDILQKAQQTAEELYISAEQLNTREIKNPDANSNDKI